MKRLRFKCGRIKLFQTCVATGAQLESQDFPCGTKQRAQLRDNFMIVFNDIIPHPYLTIMKFSHAIVAQIPDNIKFDKKLKIDSNLLRKQHQDLLETLRESGVTIITVPPISADSAQVGLFLDDVAVAINGIALTCRPHNDGIQLFEISQTLAKHSWAIVETPVMVNGKKVVLEGGDVLYTGREIFVGIRKHGTNMEGAQILAKTFCDISVIPIYLSDKALGLKHYVSVAGPGVLSIGSSKDASTVLKRMEHECKFRYHLLTADDDDAVNCLLVNNHLIFRQDKNNDKFACLKRLGLELWSVDLSELAKVGAPFSRLVLLYQQKDDLHGSK